MTLITWYLTKGCFYSDLAVVHVEGLTTPSPHLGAFQPKLGTFLRVSPPAWECYCARGDFLGANSCQLLPWRRLFLTTLALSVSSPRRRLVLTLAPGVDFDLDLVNARVRDGTIPIPSQISIA